MAEIRRTIRLMLAVMVVMAAAIVTLLGETLKHAREIQELKDHVDSIDLDVRDSNG